MYTQRNYNTNEAEPSGNYVNKPGFCSEHPIYTMRSKNRTETLTILQPLSEP